MYFVRYVKADGIKHNNTSKDYKLKEDCYVPMNIPAHDNFHFDSAYIKLMGHKLFCKELCCKEAPGPGTSGEAVAGGACPAMAKAGAAASGTKAPRRSNKGVAELMTRAMLEALDAPDEPPALTVA